ncbi:por, partial [Symbiodinium microadriaticum]
EDLDLLFGSKPSTSSPSVVPAVPRGGVEDPALEQPECLLCACWVLLLMFVPFTFDVQWHAPTFDVDWAILASARSADASWVKRLRQERELKAVHLELTTRCNAACPQCPRNLQGGVENPVLAAHHSELSLEDVRAILPPGFLRQLRKVYLCGNFGDPAVAQDCAEVIRYLLSVGGSRVGLFTNGGARSPVWWEELSIPELGSIMQPPERAFVRFAIDGDESTNHLYRQHVRWERLMANVDAFLAAGGNAEWDFIVFEHNEHQVEAMRSLAEQKGFTKFNAKKTARFIDKARGAVKPSVPVKDTSGSVVRTLRPPANPAWQNEAALESVQKAACLVLRELLQAVEKYGSIEAYYDSCEISCKVAKEKEVYISADGLAFPCCWLAAEMYRADLPNSGREVVRLAKAAFPQEGLHALSALRRGVGAAVDRRAGLFQQLVPAAMRQPSLREGRLRTCSGVCGVEVNAFAKQFAGAAQHLDPVRRSRAASAATVAPAPVEGSPVEVWYGSETGTAEQLALRAAEALGSEAAVSVPPPWDQVEARLHGCRALVLVLATWGQGEPTEDAQGLFRFLRERGGKAKRVFPPLPVAIFGLGSSLWPHFNAAAREAEELIRSLGAPILIRLGEGDAAKGHLDSDFDAWLQELLVALKKLGLDSSGGPPRVRRSTDSVAIVPMTVVRVTRLAPRDPVARYFEVQLRGAVSHGFGDALGVLPTHGGFAGARRPRWYTIASAPTSSDDQLPSQASRDFLQLLPRACREAAMAMTIDCGKLVSKFNSPPAAMSLKVDGTVRAATPNRGAGVQMDGVLAYALKMFLKVEEARIDPGMNVGSDIMKVPVPELGPMLPPPQPHSVQRPPKDPRFRPIPLADRANLVFSKGSVGHPFTCAAACRYVKRKGGCRRGADCNLCHECFWSKDSEMWEQAQEEKVAQAGPVFVPSQEDVTDEFAGLLSEVCMLQPLPQQESYPASGFLGSMDSAVGMEGFAGVEMPAMNPGSLGHPHSCGPACKYAQKSRGCKDGDMCSHCHLCQWTRFSAKSLKL